MVNKKRSLKNHPHVIVHQRALLKVLICKSVQMIGSLQGLREEGAIFGVLYPSKNFAVVPGPQTSKASHFFELGQKC